MLFRTSIFASRHLCWAKNDVKYFKTAKKQLQKNKAFDQRNKFIYSAELNKLRSDQNIIERSPCKIENKTSTPRETKSFNKQLSKPLQNEVIFGIHPVYLALLKKRRTLYRLFLKTDTERSTNNINASKKRETELLARELGIPIVKTDARGIRSLVSSSAVHQGVCLEAGKYPLEEWQEDNYLNLDKSNIRNSCPLWLILYEVLDPMNVGAVIRSAHYFGVDALFIVKDKCCRLSPTVSKASSGALEIMDIYKLEDLEEFLKRRRDQDWDIVSTVAFNEDETDICAPLVDTDQLNISKPTILILGNEGKGIPEGIQKLCNIFISINPHSHLHHGIDSLNVSVATGIILHALSQARRKAQNINK